MQSSKVTVNIHGRCRSQRWEGFYRCRIASQSVHIGRKRHEPPRLVSQPALEPGNLGELSSYASSAVEDLGWAAQRVSPDSFANRGLYVDPAIVFSSGFLLLLLLALSFQRILGLDRFMAEWLLKQQDDKRRTVREAKQRLERSWQDQQDGEGGGSGGTGSSSNNGKGQ
uniref:Uncharacterized protein n=1 Tax=Chlamydomonas leiostraca TaxID=1034604 RepID=A0A7S0S028_9CHLO